MLILYQKTGKIPKIYKNDETLPKNWKSYHKMKIIPVDFRRFPTPAEAKRIICQQSSENKYFRFESPLHPHKIWSL